MSRRGGTIFTALIAAALAAVPSTASAVETRRFALLIANNEGGDATLPLRYAKDDAIKLGAVLQELGGYQEEDIRYVLDGGAEDTRRALVAIESRVAKAKASGAHTSLLVYYSGHARDGALRLGESRLPMIELKSALTKSIADVRLGIIDACQSGAITRVKGGRPGPSFMFDADDGQGAKGLVLISSSSDDENSQESDEIGGSYFTHYLASGLRGDADDSGDRRVTLAEVYLYAYHKTVEQTVVTRSGVQHPTYSFDLQGSGNLVLTDLSKGRAGVLFASTLAGDYIIFDRAREQVAAEVRKASGQPRRIALPPGEYVIKKRLVDHLRMQPFQLGESGDFLVDESRMERVAFEDDYAKGPYSEEPSASPAFAVKSAYQIFLSGNARRTLFPPVFLFGAGASIDQILGAELGLDVMAGGRGAQQLDFDRVMVGYNFLEAQVGLELMWRLGDDRWSLIFGPRIAGLYFRRSFPDDPLLASLTQDLFAISPSLASGIGFTIDKRWTFSFRGSLGVLPFGVDENKPYGYGELSLMAGLKL